VVSPWSPKSSFPLRSKKMIASIATHFEKEQYSTFVERTLAATGKSRRILFNIRKELRETGTLTSPIRPSSREMWIRPSLPCRMQTMPQTSSNVI